MNPEQLTQLERLSVLRQQGAITTAEFEQQKAALLGSTPPPVPPVYQQTDEPDEAPKSNVNFYLGIIGVLFVLAIGFILIEPAKPTKQAPKSRKEVVDGFFSPWDGSHPGLEKAVKRSMNDPDSYEHIETRFVDKKATIKLYMSFRGKNAFGGKIVNMAEGTIDGNTGELVSWNMVKN